MRQLRTFVRAAIFAWLCVSAAVEGQGAAVLASGHRGDSRGQGAMAALRCASGLCHPFSGTLHGHVPEFGMKPGGTIFRRVTMIVNGETS